MDSRRAGTDDAEGVHKEEEVAVRSDDEGPAHGHKVEVDDEGIGHKPSGTSWPIISSGWT